MRHDGEILGYTQVPHYATHAIEFFRSTGLLLTDRAGLDPTLELFLAGYLEHAVKFLLPDNGFLLAEHDYKPSMFDLLKLPFPACALEFTADDTLYAQGSGLIRSTKRIALCFDPHQLPPTLSNQFERLAGPGAPARLPEHALCVMAVYSVHELWAACGGVVVIDLEHDQPMRTTEAAAAKLAFAKESAARYGGAFKLSGHSLPAAFWAFPARAQALGQTMDEALQALYIDTIDETRVVYEFLGAVNASNVGTQTVPAPQTLNQKRARKGKVPFYPYKILDLAPSAAAGAPGTGTHGSPRTHLRRGHLRRLHERHGGKVVWINATVVNASRPDERPDADVYRVRV